MKLRVEVSCMSSKNRGRVVVVRVDGGGPVQDSRVRPPEFVFFGVVCGLGTWGSIAESFISAFPEKNRR